MSHVRQYLNYGHCDRIVRDSGTVLKPDGGILFTYITDALPRALCSTALRAFKRVPLHTDNRGAAAGGRFRTRTGRWQARPAPSGVMGFLDRDHKSPHCRMTAITMKYPEARRAVWALAAHVDRIYREVAPGYYMAQRAFVDTVPPCFVIPGSVFTTTTINRSFRTAGHLDANNFRGGLGAMLVLEGGAYEGGELIFPDFRAGVDMRTGGLCLADVNEVHGNVPSRGPRFTRLSFVFYARRGMARCCPTVEEERDRVRRLGLAEAPEGGDSEPPCAEGKRAGPGCIRGCRASGKLLLAHPSASPIQRH